MGKGISIITLGNLTFRYRGEIVTGFTSRKAKALLLYLAVERGNYHRRESLFTLLWPGMPEISARHNLNQVLYTLRKTFPEVGANDSDELVPLLISDHQTAQINPKAIVDIDVYQLDQLLEKIQAHEHPSLADCETCIQSLVRSVNLYSCEFLSDFYLEDSNQYDAWSEAVRENCRRKIIDVLETLANIAIQKQDYEKACSYTEQQLTIDNLRESAHHQTMEALALSGRRVEALRHYRIFSQALSDELKISPSKEISDLYERIRQSDPAILPIKPETQAKEPHVSQKTFPFQPISIASHTEDLTLLRDFFRGPETQPITIFPPARIAQTYKVFHPVLNRQVSLKVLHRHLATESDYIFRFKSEADVFAVLDHPNIEQVYEFDVDGEFLYMVTELIEGPTLEDVILDRHLKDDDFSIEEIANIFSEIAAALDYAHKLNLIHQDLKPANIQFAQDGKVVITNFGIARIVGALRPTSPGLITITPEYRSPEIHRGKEGNKSDDIYSLGVILYQVVTGQVPFEADTPMGVFLQHITSPIPLPTAIKPNIPKALEQIILKAMHKAPAKRFQSAGDMVIAIREISGLEALEKSWLADDPNTEENSQTQSLFVPQKKADALKRFHTPYQHAIPFQAPNDTSDFVSRDAEIHLIGQQLLQNSEQNILCIVGMGGIGKTALAVRLAHNIRNHFPDGILWADVGLSETLAILDSWAQALNLDFSYLPDEASRAATVRSELADKQALIILDDVPTPSSIKYLLPGITKSAVLITTRNNDLPIALRAQKIELKTLSKDACRILLKEILGETRLKDETDDKINELIEILGGLPLAVKIAAQRLVSRPRWRIATIVERLQNQKNRLDELVMSNLAVRASFSISWEALEEPQQRILSLLGVFQGRAFRASALAAIAKITRDEADDYLNAFKSLSLLSEKGEKHYQQHPLLANFSDEKLGEDNQAFGWMVHYYLSFTQQNREAFQALEDEWDNIAASLLIAYQQKMYAEVLSFCNSLIKVWFARGRFSTARQFIPWACEAAEALDLPLATAQNYRLLAQACIEQGDYDEAIEHLQRNLAISQALNESGEIGRVKIALGRISIEQSKFDEAKNLLIEGQHIHEQTDDIQGFAEILYRRSRIPFYFAKFDEAEKLATQALGIQEKIGDYLGCIRTMNHLADVIQQKGDLDLGERYCQRSIELCDEIDEQGEKAVAIYTLSDIHLQQGKLLSARDLADRSRLLAKRMGDRKLQAHALYQLGTIDKSREEYELALIEFTQSLQIYLGLQDKLGVTYVLTYLGDIYQAQNQSDQAIETWSEALSLAESLQIQLAKALSKRINELR